MLTKEERCDWVRRGHQDPKTAYNKHAVSAAQRGIAFELTFDQWWDLWRERYAQRGTMKGQYVMCRTADQGPYAVGNVRIATVTENAHERVLEYLTANGRKEHAHRQITPPSRGSWLWRRNVFAEYSEECDEC